MSRTWKREDDWSWKLHQGRYWKRKLSKVKRLAWKHELRTGEPYGRGLPRVESEVNWKCW